MLARFAVVLLLSLVATLAHSQEPISKLAPLRKKADAVAKGWQADAYLSGVYAKLEPDGRIDPRHLSTPPKFEGGLLSFMYRSKSAEQQLSVDLHSSGMVMAGVALPASPEPSTPPAGSDFLDLDQALSRAKKLGFALPPAKDLNFVDARLTIVPHVSGKSAAMLWTITAAEAKVPFQPAMGKAFQIDAASGVATTEREASGRMAREDLAAEITRGVPHRTGPPADYAGFRDAATGLAQGWNDKLRLYEAKAVGSASDGRFRISKGVFKFFDPTDDAIETMIVSVDQTRVKVETLSDPQRKDRFFPREIPADSLTAEQAWPRLAKLNLGLPTDSVALSLINTGLLPGEVSRVFDSDFSVNGIGAVQLAGVPRDKWYWRTVGMRDRSILLPPHRGVGTFPMFVHVDATGKANRTAASDSKPEGGEKKDLRFSELLGAVFLIRGEGVVAPQEATLNRALQEMINRDYRSALPIIETALNQKPDWQPALLARATCLIHLGRFAEAKSDAEKAVRVHPEDAAALHLRALAKESLDDLRGAMADFDEARFAWTRDSMLVLSRFHNYRGIARMRAGYLVGAVQDFHLQIDRRPDDRDGLWNRAAGWYLLHEDDRAEKDFVAWQKANVFSNDAKSRARDAAKLSERRSELAALRAGERRNSKPLARLALAKTVEEAVSLFETASASGDLEFMTQIFGVEVGASFGPMIESAKSVGDSKRRLTAALRKQFPGQPAVSLPGTDLDLLRKTLTKSVKLAVADRKGSGDRLELHVSERVAGSSKTGLMKMKAGRTNGHWYVHPDVVSDAAVIDRRTSRLARFAEQVLVLSLDRHDSPEAAARRVAELWAEAAGRKDR